MRRESLLGGEGTVIVGGGVIGLAVAYELARRGRAVTVLERGRVGRGATWASGGMLAPVAEAETEGEELVSFGQESLRRYPDFVAGLERLGRSTVGHRTEGTLWVAVHRDHREELERLERTLSLKGLTVQRLDASGVEDLEPHLGGRVTGALLLCEDHQVDPRRLVQCLSRAIAELGGRVIEGAEVLRIVERQGRVRSVVTRRENGDLREFDTGEVVLAAGAWSFAAIDLPLQDPGLRPLKGQLIRLRGAPLVDRVLRSPDVYLIPRQDGELLVGATMEEVGYDAKSTAGAILDLLRHAWEVLPAVYDLELCELCVGLRSAVEDHRPVVGPTCVEGLYLALGHYRNGVLLAPATAHHLAQTILEGRPSEALAPFAPNRCDELVSPEGAP